MLKIRNLRKKFGQNEVLKGIDLNLKSNEILSVLGSSGSGKSTLLRCIARLESSQYDELECGSNVGFMFQNYALFPHLSVYDNIAFALNKLSKKEADDRINELLIKFSIQGLKDKKPDQISGGQAQRVAFARAIAAGAKLLLLDEPFSNLDQGLKQALRVELKDMIQAHVAYTNSEKGKLILDNFKEYLPKFKKIIPHDYKRMLNTIVQMEEKGLSSEQAQIEAFYANRG